MNGLHLLSVSMQQDRFCHHALSSKGRSILTDGIKMMHYQRIGGLKLIQMDGHLIRSDLNGFKISLFQPLMVAV